MALLSFTSFNPLLALERFFAQPLYVIRSTLSQQGKFPIFVKPADKYTLLLVGDSMTQFLGDASDLKEYLKKYYPKKEIDIVNYGIGSTSILSIPARLKVGSIRDTETLPPILEKQFDLLILESMGNNPLSELPLSEGLKKQTETLDEIMQIIRGNKPKVVIAFAATISPSQDRYGEGIVNLTDDRRKAWASERISYIKNHIEYAKSHQIPLINIFEKSLDEGGNGNIDYLDSHDFIHPSPTGILFISQEIAQFIFKNRIFPL